MKAIGVAGIVFIVFFIALAAYAYVNYLAPAIKPLPVQEQKEGQTQESRTAALAINVDTANDVIRMENYAASSADVFVDGLKVAGSVDASAGTVELEEPLPAGDHTVKVVAGDESAEKKVTVEEKWVIAGFAVAATAK